MKITFYYNSLNLLFAGFMLVSDLIQISKYVNVVIKFGSVDFNNYPT